MQEKGWEVYTAAPGDDYGHILEDWGADFLLIDFDSAEGEMEPFLSTQIPVAVTCSEERKKEGPTWFLKPFNPSELVSSLENLFFKH